MKLCIICQSSFSCSASSDCWCGQYPPVFSPLESTDCLCPGCLKSAIVQRTEQYAQEIMEGKRPNDISELTAPGNSVQEGIDFYIENGLYVFKAWYHLRRGYCCGNRCRHCPFAHKNVSV